MRRRQWVGLLLVVILAAAMRLYRLDAVEFYHDEAMVGMLAQEMADGQTFPLQGIVSSVGIPNPPQTVYTVLPPFWFSNDPVFVTSWVILLNLVGVALLYILTLRQFGFPAAMLTTLIYAVNPWAIMYSRKLWAQDYVTPFLLLSLLFAQLGFRDGKRWAQVLTVPVMLWGMQIHFAAWALVPLFGWVILAGRKNWHWRSLILSAVISLMVLTPFMLGIIQTLGQDPTRIGDSLRASTGRDLDGGLSPWVHWFRLLTGDDIKTWLLPANDFTTTKTFSATLMLLSLIPVSLTALWMLFRRHGWGVWGAFVLWLILPPLAFDLILSDVWPHYFIPLLPGFALFFGLALTPSTADEHKPSKLVSWTYFIGLIPFAILGGGLLLLLAWMSLYLVSFESYFLPIMFMIAAILGYLLLKPIFKNRPFWSRENLRRFVLFSFTLTALFFMSLDWISTLRESITHGSFQGAGTAGYTTPAYVLNRVADSLPRETDDVVVLTRDMDIWFDSEAARWPVMLRDVAACVRALPSDGYAVFPNHLFTVITTPDAGASLATLYTDAVQTISIENRAMRNPYTTSIFEVAPTWTRSPITELATPIRFDNDVLLTGYGFADGEIYLRWSLPDAPDRRFYESRGHDVQFFVHLMDAAGNRIGQLDKQFWQARNWCAGDTLYTWGNLTGTQVESIASVRVGFYRLGLGKESGQTFPLDVLDAMGNPTGNWTDIEIK